MNKEIEIIVRKSYILSKASEMERIAQNVANKQIENNISHSKGQMVCELNKLINELNKLGTNLSALMMENSLYVKNIGETFENADQKIAAAYRE